MFWLLSGMTWLEYLPAKNKVFSVCCAGAGCTGCHFSYLLHLFIFKYISQFCKIDTNRHQFGATGQNSGIFLLAGVGGVWCHFSGHWCHLFGLFLLLGDVFASLRHCITSGCFVSSAFYRTNYDSVNVCAFVNRKILTKSP